LSVFNLRRYKNTDPPHLAEIWNSQPPQRGLMYPISPNLLEHCVYSKQYFDPEGLIVATRDNKPIGFAHAGFGPSDDGESLDTTLGVTQMVLMHGSTNYPRMADELVRECEKYLRSRGAKVLYGGGIDPLNPFYLGLYGGSELPGLLESDGSQVELFCRNGYQPTGQVVILQRDLARFRPQVSRTHRQIRRDALVEYDPNPEPGTWFEACRTCATEQLGFTLARRSDGEELAAVSLWDIEPLASSWGVRTAGIYELYVDQPHRRMGYASYLLGEAFKEVLKRGISMVEAHTMADNSSAIALYEKLGFTRVDTGVVLRREGEG